MALIQDGDAHRWIERSAFAWWKWDNFPAKWNLQIVSHFKWSNQDSQYYVTISFSQFAFQMLPMDELNWLFDMVDVFSPVCWNVCWFVMCKRVQAYLEVVVLYCTLFKSEPVSNFSELNILSLISLCVFQFSYCSYPFWI